MLDTYGKYQGIANAMTTNDAIKAHTAQTLQQTAQSSNDYASKQIGAWLALPDNLRTQGTARQLIDHLADSGAMQPANVDVWHNIVNQTTSQPELDKMAGRALISTMSGPEAAMKIFGSPVRTDTGTGVATGTLNDPMRQAMQPGTPTYAPGGPGTTVEQYPSRGARATPVRVGTAPDGTPIMGPAESVMPPALAAPPAAGGGSQWPGTPDGRLPPALTNPNKAPVVPAPPVVSGGPGSALAPGGTFQPNQSPAVAASQTTMGDASGKRFMDIAAMGNQAQTTSALIGNTLSDASIVKTGPGTDLYKRVGRVLQAAGMPVDADKITGLESINKNLAQIVGAQNAGSDERLGIVKSGNPSYDMSPQGFDYVLKQMAGTANWAKAYAQLAATATPAEKADSPTFDARMRKELNPQAFQLDQLHGAEAKMYLSGLPPQQKAALYADYPKLKAAGLFGAP